MELFRMYFDSFFRNMQIRTQEIEQSIQYMIDTCDKDLRPSFYLK